MECILLNACYSEIQAKAIAQHIEYVIGMSQEIGDRAAIEFSVGFYDALGAGRNIEVAYKFACNAIQIASIPEYLTPKLLRKNQFDLQPSPIIISCGSIDRDCDKRVSIYHPPSIEQHFTLPSPVSGELPHAIEPTVSKFDSSFPAHREVEFRSTLPVSSLAAIDELHSEKGVDYTQLRNLLATGKWKEADEETLTVMLKVAGREKQGSLMLNPLIIFPVLTYVLLTNYG